MNRAQAYKYTFDFLAATQNGSVDAVMYKGYNLADITYTDIYLCILNHFSGNKSTSGFPANISNAGYFLRRKLSGFTNRMNKKHYEVVFLPSSFNHLKQMVPVARILEEKGLATIFLSNKKNLIQFVKTAGFDYQYLVPAKNIPARQKQQLEQQIKNLTTQLPWLTEELAAQISAIICGCYLMVSGLEKDFTAGITNLGYKFILIGNDVMRDGYFAAELFKHYKIPSASIMHGIMTTENPLHNHIKVDYYFLFGEYFREHFKSFGFTDDRLFIEGVPAFDEVHRKQHTGGRPVSNKLGFGDKKYVLAAFSGPGHTLTVQDHLGAIESLHAAIKHLGDKNILIKLHQKDRKEYYQAILDGGYKNVRIIDQYDNGFEEYNIIDYLLEASAIISINSTSIFEAMYFDVPVVALNLENRFTHLDFLNPRFVWLADNGEEIARCIHEIESGENKGLEKIENAKAFITNIFGRNDGDSSARIAHKITSLI